MIRRRRQIELALQAPGRLRRHAAGVLRCILAPVRRSGPTGHQGRPSAGRLPAADPGDHAPLARGLLLPGSVPEAPHPVPDRRVGAGHPRSRVGDDPAYRRIDLLSRYFVLAALPCDFCRCGCPVRGHHATGNPASPRVGSAGRAAICNNSWWLARATWAGRSWNASSITCELGFRCGGIPG